MEIIILMWICLGACGLALLYSGNDDIEDKSKKNSKLKDWIKNQSKIK